MQRKTSGNRGEDRASALWGSGNRGGELRSNALWGKGGKGLLVAVATVALAVPFALTSNAGAGGGKGPLWAAKGDGGYVQADLLERAKANPKSMFDEAIPLKLPQIKETPVRVVDLNRDGDKDLFVMSTQGSILVERSFLEHGYARGRILQIHRKPR